MVWMLMNSPRMVWMLMNSHIFETAIRVEEVSPPASKVESRVFGRSYTMSCKWGGAIIQRYEFQKRKHYP